MRKLLEVIRDIEMSAETLEKKVFRLLLILSFSGGIVSLVFSILEGMRGKALILVGICLLIPASALYLSRKTGKYSAIYSALCILENCVFLPVTFFSRGGFRSGMPLIMAGAMILTGLIVERKRRFILFAAAFAVQCGVFLLAVLRPELVTPMDEDLVQLEQIIAFLCVELGQLVAVTVVLSEYERTLEKEKKLSDQKAMLRFDMMEAQHENVEAVRRMRHDARHHNALIIEMLKNRQYEELMQYMQQKQESDARYATVIYCMNPVVNSILSVYTRKAEKSGIAAQVKAEVPVGIAVTDPDMVAMLSNIYENAIHGAEQSGREEKRIAVDVSMRGSRLVISCRNTCSGELELHNGYPTPVPGTGILSILEAAKQYDGILTYDVQDGMLLCSLILTV